jgi:hypothetical protein
MMLKGKAMYLRARCAAGLDFYERVCDYDN